MLKIKTLINITGQATTEDFQTIFNELDFYKNNYLSFQIESLKFTIQENYYNPLESTEFKFLNFLKNYDIGVDYLESKDGEITSISDIDEISEWEEFFDKNDYFYVKVLGYCHGGITLSLAEDASEQGGWDDGIAGYLVIKKDKLRNLRGVKRLTPKILNEEREFLRSIVSELENYLEGRQYEAIIDGDGIYESILIEYAEDAAEFFANFFNQNKAA